jgi:hypothetical protein
MLRKLIKVSIACIGLAVLPVISSAQSNIAVPTVNVQYALSNELNVEVDPTYPRPNETVSINLTLYTDDLNSADITWYQDGKSVLSGKGETTYSFRAGSVGEETNIEIKIKLLSGTSFSKTITLDPAGVDMVWEAYSYVPPFYNGKALHPMQGIFKVVAMPEFVKNGKRVSAQNLIYQWSNMVDVYQSQSGYGKSVAILNGSLLGKQENIKVLVTDPVNNLSAEGFLDVTPVNPEIVFYQNDPYYGNIFDTAITGTFNLKTDEVQVLAAPYYFTEQGGGLQYEWLLNGQTIPNLSGSRTAIFRKPEDKTSGISKISLQITNTNRILQEADGNLTMQFQN